LNEKVLWLINILLAAFFAGMVIFMTRHPAEKEKIQAETSVNIQNELITQDDWAFFLVDNGNPLGADYKVELAEICPNHYMDKRAAPYAVKMLENAEKDGVALNVVSSYRNLDKQSKNFEDYVKRLLDEGYTREDAMTITAEQIAHPGASEHNAGLAIDIVTADWWNGHDDITADFADSPEFDWLKRNAWKYGFVMRYPEAKEGITGIMYEPWHYRFVGVFRAEQMRYSDLCLEEYVELVNGDAPAK